MAIGIASVLGFGLGYMALQVLGDEWKAHGERPHRKGMLELQAKLAREQQERQTIGMEAAQARLMAFQREGMQRETGQRAQDRLMQLALANLAAGTQTTTAGIQALGGGQLPAPPQLTSALERFGPSRFHGAR